MAYSTPVINFLICVFLLQRLETYVYKYLSPFLAARKAIWNVSQFWPLKSKEKSTGDFWKRLPFSSFLFLPGRQMCSWVAPSPSGDHEATRMRIKGADKARDGRVEIWDGPGSPTALLNYTTPQTAFLWTFCYVRINEHGLLKPLWMRLLLFLAEPIPSSVSTQAH